MTDLSGLVEDSRGVGAEVVSTPTELHRARLRELEERQRRLQQLCQAALQYSDEDAPAGSGGEPYTSTRAGAGAGASIPENVIDDDGEEPAAATVLLERQKMCAGAAYQRVSQHITGSTTIGEEATTTTTRPAQYARHTFLSSPPPGPALEGSRSGRAGQEDLLTGEVQSFRDPASMARNSSVNSNLIRAPSPGMTNTTAAPPVDAASSTLKSRDWQRGSTRYNAPLSGMTHEPGNSSSSGAAYSGQHVRPTLYPLPTSTTINNNNISASRGARAPPPPPPPQASGVPGASSSSLFASTVRANEENASFASSWRARVNARQYNRTRAAAGTGMLSPGLEAESSSQPPQPPNSTEEGGTAATMSVAALRAKYGVAANARRRSADGADMINNTSLRDDSARSGSAALRRRRYNASSGGGGLSAPTRDSVGPTLSPAANATMAGLFGPTTQTNNNRSNSNINVSYNDPVRTSRFGTQTRPPPPPPPPSYAEREGAASKAKMSAGVVSPMPYNSLREKYGLKPQRPTSTSPAAVPTSAGSDIGLSNAARQYFGGGGNTTAMNKPGGPTGYNANAWPRSFSQAPDSASLRSGPSSRYAPQHYFRDNTADNATAFRRFSSANINNNSLSYSFHGGTRHMPPPPPPPPNTNTAATNMNAFQRTWSTSSAFLRRGAWEKYSIGRSTTAEEEDKLRRYFAREETDLSWLRRHPRRSVSQPVSSNDASYGMPHTGYDYNNEEGGSYGKASRSRAHTLEARRREYDFLSPQPRPRTRSTRRATRPPPPPPPPPLPTARDDITGLVEDPSETMSSMMGSATDDEYDSLMARDEQTARPGYSPAVSAAGDSTPPARGFAQAEGPDGMMYSTMATPNAPATAGATGAAAAYRVSHEATRRVMQGHKAEAAAGLRGFLHTSEERGEEEEGEEEGVMNERSERAEESAAMKSRRRTRKAKRQQPRSHKIHAEQDEEEEEEEEVLSAVGQDMYGRMHATLLSRRPPARRSAAHTKSTTTAAYYTEGDMDEEGEEEEDNVAMGESASVQSTPAGRGRVAQGNSSRGHKNANNGQPHHTTGRGVDNNNSNRGVAKGSQVSAGQGKGKRTPAQQQQQRKKHAAGSPRPLSAAQVRQPRHSPSPSAQRTETSEQAYSPNEYERDDNEGGTGETPSAERAEKLARHLVKAIFDKKLLQDQVEQLEQLVEESNMELGRLQNIVEEQDDAAGTVQGVQAALRAKENELAVCEAEIERLHNIFQAHLARITPDMAGTIQKHHGKGQQLANKTIVTTTEGAVMQASEIEAAFIEVGVARVAQQAAEDKATQLASELESAVEQIQMLDGRLAEMERGAAAQRLQEVRQQLGPGVVDNSNSLNDHYDGMSPLANDTQQAQLGRDSVESLRTTMSNSATPGLTGQEAAIRVPSADETSMWPLAARRALAQLVSHAEGLLVQNAESARSASVRLQHVEHDSRSLRQALQVKHEELQALQRECAALRQEKNALRLCGEQWYTLLSAVKEEARLVSELVATSRADAEELALRAHVAASQRAALGGPVSAEDDDIDDEDNEESNTEADTMSEGGRNTNGAAPLPRSHYSNSLPVLKKGEGRLLQDAAVHAALVAQDASVQQSRQFARQVMRDLNVVARFLFALREMDIGSAADHEALVSIANTPSSAYPTPNNALTNGNDAKGRGKTTTRLAQLTASQMAILEKVQARRDFVLRAVEQALAQGDSEAMTHWASLQRRHNVNRDDDSLLTQNNDYKGNSNVKARYEQTTPHSEARHQAQGTPQPSSLQRSPPQGLTTPPQQQQQESNGNVIHEPSPLSEVDEMELQHEGQSATCTGELRDTLSSSPEVDRTLPPPLPAAPAVVVGVTTTTSPHKSDSPHSSHNSLREAHHQAQYQSTQAVAATPPVSLRAETERDEDNDDDDEAYYTSPNLRFRSPTESPTSEQHAQDKTRTPHSETVQSPSGSEVKRRLAMTEPRVTTRDNSPAEATRSPSHRMPVPSSSSAERTEGSALPTRRSLTARPSLTRPHSTARISLDVDDEDELVGEERDVMRGALEPRVVHEVKATTTSPHNTISPVSGALDERSEDHTAHVMPAVLEVDTLYPAQPRRLQSPPRETTETNAPPTAATTRPVNNTPPAAQEDDEDTNEPSLHYLASNMPHPLPSTPPPPPPADSMTIPSIMTADNTTTNTTATMLTTMMLTQSTTATTAAGASTTTMSVAKRPAAQASTSVAEELQPTPTQLSISIPAVQTRAASHVSRQSRVSNTVSSGISEGLASGNNNNNSLGGGVALPRLQRSLTVSRASTADMSPTTPPAPHPSLSTNVNTSSNTTTAGSRPPSRQNSMHRESSALVESAAQPSQHVEGNTAPSREASDAPQPQDVRRTTAGNGSNSIERTSLVQPGDTNNNNNSRQPSPVSSFSSSSLMTGKPSALPPRRTAMSTEAVRDLTHGPGLPALHPSSPPTSAIPQPQPQQEKNNNSSSKADEVQAAPPPTAPAPVQTQTRNDTSAANTNTTTTAAAPTGSAWASAASMYYSFSTGQPRARSPPPSVPAVTASAPHEAAGDMLLVTPRVSSTARLRSASREDRTRPARRSDSLDTLHEAAPRETLAASRLQTAIDLLDEEEEEEESASNSDDEHNIALHEGGALGSVSGVPRVSPSLLVRVSPPPSVAPLPPLPSPRGGQVTTMMNNATAHSNNIDDIDAGSVSSDDDEDDDVNEARTCISAATASTNDTSVSPQAAPISVSSLATSSSAAYAPAQSAAVSTLQAATLTNTTNTLPTGESSTQAVGAAALVSTPSETALETATSRTPHTTELSSLTTSPPSREVSHESNGNRSPSGSYSASTQERRRAEVDSILERLRAQKEKRRSQ